ncbi:MAG: hypothetical protein AB7P61_13785 [Gemmatimonadales bacterium]
MIDEALSICGLPSARLELSMRVRRGRPAPPRDLLLHALVRLLHDRGEEARRMVRESRMPLDWRDVFPELPIVFDDAVLLAGTPDLVGV